MSRKHYVICWDYTTGDREGKRGKQVSHCRSGKFHGSKGRKLEWTSWRYHYEFMSCFTHRGLQKYTLIDMYLCTQGDQTHTHTQFPCPSVEKVYKQEQKEHSKYQQSHLM